MSVLQEPTSTFREIPQHALRNLLKKAAGPSSNSLGDGCGGGCSRGASCNTRSEEMEELVSGSD